MKGRVGIWGLGESGVGAALLAQRYGYELVLVANQPPAPTYAQRLLEHGLSWQIVEDPVPLLQTTDWVVRSPGIRPDAPALEALHAAGIPIISDIEWGWRHSPPTAQLWMVTGSSGKSSTTYLLAHLLRTAGIKAIACGNIGYSFCAALAEPDPYDYYVVEASSFQLWDTPSAVPHLLVITGLSPNHIDWHGTLEAYAHAKLHIVERLTEHNHLIYDADSSLLERWLNKFHIKAQVWRYAFQPREGIHAWVEGNKLVCDMKTNDDAEKWEVSYEGTPIESLPQRKNSLAAAIPAKLAGLRRSDLRRTFETLGSLPHRLERVDTIEGVSYINDSKATTPLAVWYALQSFERPIIWIAGGVDKGGDWGEILDVVRARVKALILIGKDPARIYQAFHDTVPIIERAASMEEAVRKAHALANPEDVVLLSPGCSSFDWYQGYEQRGAAFQEAVRKLREERYA